MTEVRLSHGDWAVGRAYGWVDAYLLVFWMWGRGDAEVRHGRALPGLDGPCQARRRPPAVQAVLAREGFRSGLTSDQLCTVWPSVQVLRG